MRPRAIALGARGRRRGNVSPESAQRGTPAPTGDVVASTFANADLRFTKAAMSEYWKRCDALSRDNALLREQMEEQESDSIKVVQYLKTKLQNAEAVVTEQRGEIERLLHENAEAEEALRCQYERMLGERDEQISQYASITQALQSELKASSQQVQDRAIHRLELQKLQDEIEEIRMRHECELAALRFQSVDRKMRLVALEETMRERFRMQVETESMRLLEVKSKALIEDHEALQQERIRLTQDIEELVQLTTAKNTECADVRRKGELHRRACEEALQRIVNGGRRARDLAMRTQRLEQRVKELIQEKQVIREELSRQYEAQIQELKKALTETQRSLQLHRTELQRLRYAASTVVDQRSDLERFFYVALNDVRRMRSGSQRGPKALKRHVPASARQLPSLTNAELVNVTGLSGGPTHANPPPRPQGPLPSPLAPQARNSSPLAPKDPTFLTESPSTANVAGSLSAVSTTVSPTCSTAVVGPSPPAAESLRRRGDAGARPTHNVTKSGNGVLPVDLGRNNEGVYLEDLSWEDKERIIKALLFFINQTCYQRLPGKCVTEDNEKPPKC